MKNIKLDFNLPISIIKEDKSYIAYTPALDLSTSGKNYEEAKKRFSEIVNIFFEEIIKKGTIENVLKDLGWKKIQAKWNPPIVVSQESQNIKVLIK
jgi:predicted RNase H-like HicB family nuclease